MPACLKEVWVWVTETLKPFSSGWGPFSKKYADFKDFSSLITIQIFKTDVVDCILWFYHNSESSSTPKSGGIGGMLKPGTRQGKHAMCGGAFVNLSHITPVTKELMFCWLNPK